MWLPFADQKRATVCGFLCSFAQLCNCAQEWMHTFRVFIPEHALWSSPHSSGSDRRTETKSGKNPAQTTLSCHKGLETNEFAEKVSRRFLLTADRMKGAVQMSVYMWMTKDQWWDLSTAKSATLCPCGQGLLGTHLGRELHFLGLAGRFLGPAGVSLVSAAFWILDVKKSKNCLVTYSNEGHRNNHHLLNALTVRLLWNKREMTHQYGCGNVRQEAHDYFLLRSHLTP